MAITGIRPMVSVSLPLNGRDRPAVNVKSAIINPLYSAPPNAVIYAGNSGISMLKLAEKRKELRHSNPKER